MILKDITNEGKRKNKDRIENICYLPYEKLKEQESHINSIQ